MTTMGGERTFLTAEWRNLAMLNYEVEPALLSEYIPDGTELDCWSGKTLASLVGFCFLKTKVCGVSVPFHRNFDDVNLRFYVRRREGSDIRRGVVFIREIASQDWRVRLVCGIRLAFRAWLESSEHERRRKSRVAETGLGRAVRYRALLGLFQAKGRRNSGVSSCPPLLAGLEWTRSKVRRRRIRIVRSRTSLGSCWISLVGFSRRGICSHSISR